MQIPSPMFCNINFRLGFANRRKNRATTTRIKKTKSLTSIFFFYIYYSVFVCGMSVLGIYTYYILTICFQSTIISYSLCTCAARECFVLLFFLNKRTKGKRKQLKVKLVKLITKQLPLSSVSFSFPFSLYPITLCSSALAEQLK